VAPAAPPPAAPAAIPATVLNSTQTENLSPSLGTQGRAKLMARWPMYQKDQVESDKDLAGTIEHRLLAGSYVSRAAKDWLAAYRAKHP